MIWDCSRFPLVSNIFFDEKNRFNNENFDVIGRVIICVTIQLNQRSLCHFFMTRVLGCVNLATCRVTQIYSCVDVALDFASWTYF